MRAHFFQVIKTHDLPEDVAPRYVIIQNTVPITILGRNMSVIFMNFVVIVHVMKSLNRRIILKLT
jgi:hypothetical protein